MPRTSLVDLEKVKVTICILSRAPEITVCEAMILANFSEEEACTKFMQRKVSHDVQKIACNKEVNGRCNRIRNRIIPAH